jgi:hypothetical protein
MSGREARPGFMGEPKRAEKREASSSERRSL